MKTCALSVRGNRLLLVAALSLSLAPRAFPINLLVYNTNDSGPGSLRQAILDNNTLGGGNGIFFSNTVTGTITLTGGELLITKHGGIDGPGAGVLAINGNGASRVFHVQITNYDTSVTISGLTITNGAGSGNYPTNSGGGIWNDHSILRVDNCVLTGNSAALGGGIFNDGSLTNYAALIVENCTLSGNSGSAIYNFGYQGGANLTARACTISSNTAYWGGGIFNDAYQGSAGVTVNGCTFSTNSAYGSGVFIGGGAIYNHGLSGSATLYVHASTFSGNTAESGGSIYNNEPTGSTIVHIGNTLLQAGASGGTIAKNFGPIISHGYNLSSDNGGGFLTNATDLLNTNPQLGSLASNGGPTFTHALLPGSPAIDKGKQNAIAFLLLTTDQRGAPRPYNFASITNAAGGDGSDIGAFELGLPTLNIQKFTADAVLTWPFYYGDFTLQSVTNVIASNSWVNVAGTPAVVANQYVLTNGPISGNRFYRLKGN